MAAFRWPMVRQEKLGLDALRRADAYDLPMENVDGSIKPTDSVIFAITRQHVRCHASRGLCKVFDIVVRGGCSRAGFVRSLVGRR